MSASQNNSIKRKLMRISLLTTGAALLLANLVLITNELVLFRRTLVNDLSIQARMIGRHCTTALLFNDPKVAAETLSVLQAAPNIVEAVIYSTDGKVFAVYRRPDFQEYPPPAPKSESAQFTASALSLDQDIFLDHKIIGKIHVLSNLNKFYALVGRYGVTVFLVLIFSLLVAFFLLSKLQQVITTPIKNLVRLMGVISLDKNYALRAPVLQKDELGALAEGFNEMLDQIQFRDRKLEGHRAQLEEEVALRTADLAEANRQLEKELADRRQAEENLKQAMEKLRKATGGIIQAMALTVESKDPYTAGHQQRVSDLGRAIAQEMGLSQDQVEAIRVAGTVHDLGKISIPAEFLTKPTKLTDLEFNLIKVHPMTSYDILKDVEFPWPIARIALQHHERLDGSGYPSGLKGDEILMEAKVLMVADVVEAIASNRPYRPAHGIERALEEISKNKGVLYDSEVVEACLRLFRERGYKLGVGLIGHLRESQGSD